MNLEEELKRMKGGDEEFKPATSENTSSLEWFEPKTGIYKVKVTNVGNTYTVNIGGKEIEKARLEVEVMDMKHGSVKQYNWGIPKSYSKMSIWGQLLALYKMWGDIVNKQFTLIVKVIETKNQKRRDYTIVEVIENMMV